MENRVMDQLINTLQNIQSTIRTISNNPSSSSNNSISNNNSNSGNNSNNSNSGSSSNDMRSSNMRTETRTPVLVEQSRLFSRNQRNHPYRRRNSNNQRGGGRTLTRTFVCLNRTDQIEVPTAEERMLLYHNKLGESRVVFPVNANSTSVRDILYKQFPQLRSCGGFEILRLNPNSTRVLKLVKSGPCPLEELRTFGSGRLYLRPIQRDIPLEDIPQSSDRERCLHCGSDIELVHMRNHLQTCTELLNYPLYDSDSHDESESGMQASSIPGQQEVSQEPEPSQRPEDQTMNNIPEPSQRQEAQRSNNIPEPSHEPEAQRSNNIPEPDNASQNTSQVATNEIPSNRPDTVEECVLLAARNMSNVHDPVTILRGFQEIFMRGRKLDVSSASEILEGETLSIFVSRDRVLETAFEELLDTSCNFRLPLDVTFYGEDAADLGGPRREFLELALKEIIKEETGLFKEDDDGSYIFRNSQENIRKRFFYAAGLVCGLSIMQHGPLPCFISESHFDNMLSDAADESQKQFRQGLNVVGLVDLMKVKPGLRYLFRPTARTDLTLRKIKHLLLPKFDEPGSNRRRRQEQVYDKFLAYLKEVAAGRREVPVGRITLGQILQFVTGSAWEPVMGFTLAPSIQFAENDRSLIPTSSTCINCLYLPVPSTGTVPENDVYFNIFDTAFCNSYFGLQ